MALVKCSECGKEISNTATTCPHCGAPRDTRSGLQKFSDGADTFSKMCFGLFGIAFCVVAAIIVFSVVFN